MKSYASDHPHAVSPTQHTWKIHTCKTQHTMGTRTRLFNILLISEEME